MSDPQPITVARDSGTECAHAGSLDGMVSLGDYVLATKYSDRDPGDPWRVGFVVRIINDKRGETYIIGDQDGTWSDFREYKHAKKITWDEGKAWIEANAEL